VPHRIREELSEVEARVGSLREDDREELERELAALRGTESERLEATAEKVARAAADWAKAEAAAQKQVTAARSLLSDLDQRLAALKAAASELPVVPTTSPAPAASAPAPGTEHTVPPSASPPRQPPASLSAQPVTSDERANGGGPEPVPEAPKKRAPKKPAAVSAPEATLFPSAEIAEPRAASEYSQAAPEEAAPATSLSADGATRLLVTAYIGIGNRLFIRGDGPGLSWDEGVPLQFVSIGKWRWETAEATRPIRFKLLKNDRDECAAPAAPPPLEPGRQQELTATFQA
jgi:hypothetical protein